MANNRFKLITRSNRFRCLGHQRGTGRFGKGITLIEVLVVMMIIGVLLGVTIPAVQVARESARRVQCQSNLKQLTFAAQSFESTHRHFPSGGWGYQWPGFSDLGSEGGQPGSWTFSLLPFLEKTALYELGRYQSEPATLDLDLRKRFNSSVSLYVCPSRRSGGQVPFDPECTSCPWPIGVLTPLQGSARCDYAVNAGDGAPNLARISTWPLAFPGPVDLEEAVLWTRTNRWPKPPADWTGISWLVRGVKLAEIRDGTSNTFLLGEKYVMRNAYDSGTDWGDNEPLYGGFNNDNHRSTHPRWPLMRDALDRMSIGSFGSPHASGTYFGMVDGSVQLISYSIDEVVYRFLGNRRDGGGTGVPR